MNIVKDVSGVNPRPYRSPKRAEQAAVTRTAILDAAAKLFGDSGYTTTTTAAVARDAGVSEAMVFAVFGSKAGLLGALIDRAVTPGEGSSALASTAGWSEALDAGGPTSAVRRFVELVATIQQRTWKLIELARTASDGDEGMAELLRHGAENRRADCRNFISSAVVDALRDDRTVEQATDILWAYTSSEIYRLMIDGAGWHHDEYVNWLGDTLATALFRHPASA